MNTRVHWYMALGVAGAVMAVAVAAIAWPSQDRVEVKQLTLEPSGLYDRAGAELPFVSLRLSVPELEDWDLEFSQDPFDVECKVGDHWTKIENRASLRWIQSEMSFLILPGTTMCRLRFRYQREGLRWRLLRAIVPRGVPYHQFPNRFWRWVWLKTPLGPKLITLMYHRNHFRRPPRWREMTADVAIPFRSASRAETRATD